MENLNEIIVVLKKLSQDGKGLYLEAKQGVALNIIKKVENKYGKLSCRIDKNAIKESKVSNTEEIFENDDTLSYKDKMYE